MACDKAVDMYVCGALEAWLKEHNTCTWCKCSKLDKWLHRRSTKGTYHTYVTEGQFADHIALISGNYLLGSRASHMLMS